MEPLDPSAPLAPMPDLGVDWPEIADDGQVDTNTANRVPALRVLPYSVRLSGLSALPVALEVREAFDAASVLKQDDERRANPAQLELRSQADAELLRELLRCSDRRVTVMPGGGLDETVIPALVADGFREIHGSASLLEGGRRRTSEARVREFRRLLSANS